MRRVLILLILLQLVSACSETQPRVRLSSLDRRSIGPTSTSAPRRVAFEASQLEVITPTTVGQLEPVLRWRAHPGAPNMLVFTPDGRRLLSASGTDHAVRVWDSATGEEIYAIVTENGQVQAAAVNLTSTYMVTTGESGNLEQWDVPSGNRVAPPIFNPGPSITSMNYSVDGTALAIGSEDGTIEVRDSSGAEVLLTVSSQRGRRSDVFDVAVSRDLIVGAYPAGSIVVWDRETGERLDRLTGHSNDVYSVTFSRDGNLLASTSSDNSVRVWDVETLEQSHYNGTDYDAGQTAFSPDGQLLASTGQGGALQIWSMSTGRRTYRLAEDITDGTFWTGAVAFSPNGKLLAYGNDNGEIVILIVAPESVAEETESNDESE